MEEIISPVNKDLLKSELTEDKLLRKTNKANNEIYIITAHSAPHTMQEIGRIREVAFRGAGGGSGKSVDIDRFDTMGNPYKQLIVWDPQAEAIIGGYRFIAGTDVIFNEKGEPEIATSSLFNFNPKFIEEYLPYTFELGRSFVTPEYQSSKSGAKSLFALDNLWDGLGALLVTDPSMKYFFGKVTMYNNYDITARDMILFFLNKYFKDNERLVTPKLPLKIHKSTEQLEQLFNKHTFKEDYKILNQEVRSLGYNIPPLVNAYMSLSPQMKVFGTALNEFFGEVEETGILIDKDEMLEEKKKRHIESYINSKPSTRFLLRLRNIINPNWSKNKE